MIGVLTHHWAKADQIDEAKKLLDGNGLAQSKAPGLGQQRDLRCLARQSRADRGHGWGRRTLG